MAENNGLKGLTLFFIGFLLCEVAITGRLGSLLGSVIAPSAMAEGNYPFGILNGPTSGSEPVGPVTTTTPSGSLPGSGSANAGTVLTDSQIAKLAYGAGFRQNNLVTAIAICLAESNGIQVIINQQDHTDYGLWQINIKAHPQYNPQRLLNDAAYNATAAYQISNGGKNWNPWSTYTNGAYKNFSTRAYTAALPYLGVTIQD